MVHVLQGRVQYILNLVSSNWECVSYSTSELGLTSSSSHAPAKELALVVKLDIVGDGELDLFTGFERRHA